jgi:hypothetical protein
MATSGTLASVVATFVIRLGRLRGTVGVVGAGALAGLADVRLVAVAEKVSRVPPQWASMSSGEVTRHLPRRETVCVRLPGV